MQRTTLKPNADPFGLKERERLRKTIAAAIEALQSEDPIRRSHYSDRALALLREELAR